MLANFTLILKSWYSQIYWPVSDVKWATWIRCNRLSCPPWAAWGQAALARVSIPHEQAAQITVSCLSPLSIQTKIGNARYYEYLYPRHTKYVKGVHSFFLFSVCVCLSACLWVNIYFMSHIFQELLYLESWILVHMTSMTSCIVGKKIGTVGSGHLELFPFVVLAICVWVNIYFVSKISQELLYLQSWNLVYMTCMTSCIVGKKIGAVGSGHLELFPFVILAICVWVNIYFVPKIFQELLYLESWNLVHMTSMTSCIVGKKIGAVGSGHLELFPFVVLAFCVWVNIYFVSKISQELLYLESWNFVHMTGMTSCIVGKKIGSWDQALRVISLCCSGYLCVS